jgi:hypothetical protein
MSATIVHKHSGADPSAAAPANPQEPNNNSDISLSSSGNSSSKRQDQQQAAVAKKRASVQSNLSAASGATDAAGQTPPDDDSEPEAGARTQMSSAEYEHVRNKTLLFFLDRLYLASKEGKEARTLHDLSCLFGTREFTKEMRQVVGASRNGLKMFLQSYPSLFLIEGDKVHLTQLKDDTQTSQRDYNKEAVEYFKQKLAQFGNSLVPIKNLFGYRSQASQEVRHVSGKNVRDFKRFLKLNEDVFEILVDEHVVLKSALRELESRGLSSLSLQESLKPVPAEEATSMDPYLNKQLAHLIEDCIRIMMAEQEPAVDEEEFRVSLEHLHDRIHEHCQNELFLKMVKTIEDLRVFLRMHPKLFKRFPSANNANNNSKNNNNNNNCAADGDESSSLASSSLNNTTSAANCYYVGLLSDRERRELEAQAHQAASLMQRQHSTLEQPAVGSTPSSGGSEVAAPEPAKASTQAAGPEPREPTTTTSNSNNNKSSSVGGGQPAADSVSSEASKQKDPVSRRPSSTGGKNAVAAAKGVASNNNKRPDENDQNKVSKQQRPALQKSQSADKPSSQKQQQQQPAQAARNSQSASHRLRANAPPFVPSRPHVAGGGGGGNHQHQPIHRQNSLLAQAYHRPAPMAAGPAAAVGADTLARQVSMPAPIQRSVSNLSPSSAPYASAQPPADPAGGSHYGSKRLPEMPPFDRRAAIRSYLLKGNSMGGGGQHNMNWGHHHHLHHHHQQQQPAPPPHHSFERRSSSPKRHQLQQWSANTSNPNDQSPSGGVATQNAVASQEDLRARTVDIVREASNIITRIMTTTDAVAFDCKGYNLGFDGKITLIQFGFLPTKQVDPMELANSMNRRFASSAPTRSTLDAKTTPAETTETTANKEQDIGRTDGANNNNNSNSKHSMKPEVCVFDLITNPELAYCLKPLLESDKVVKIVHDVRNKSNALHVQFGITLNNVFDTQVANLVIQQQVTGKPAYKSRYISMGKLCEVYGSEELMKYRHMVKIRTTSRGAAGSLSKMMSSSGSSSKDVNYWRTRPLTRPMVLEATMDVYCLVGGIYQNLKAQIKPEYKPLFDLLNLEGVLARIKPDEIRSAKKERKIDMEVIDLKRKLYSDTPGPVVLSNREIRLLRHIDLTEGVRQKIQQCKKVAKKLERLDMKAALLEQQQRQQQQAGDDGEGGQQPVSLNNSQPSSMGSRSNNSSLDAANSGAAGNANRSEDDQRREQLQARLDEFNAAVMMMDSSMFDELKDRINESTSLLESLEDDDEEEEGQLSSGHHSHNGSSINDCCRCQCHSLQQSSMESGSGGGGGRSEAASKQRDEPSSQTSKKDQPDLFETKSTTDSMGPASGLNQESEVSQQVSGQEAHKDNSSKLSDPKLSDSKTRSLIDGGEQQQKGAEQPSGEKSDEFSNSSACDMAVQCDLLTDD